MDFIRIKIEQQIYWKDAIFKLANSYHTIKDVEWSNKLEEIVKENYVYEVGLVLFARNPQDQSKICAKVWLERDTKKTLFEIESVKNIGVNQYKIVGFMYIPKELSEERTHIQTVFINSESKLLIPKGFMSTEWTVVNRTELFKDHIVFERNIEAEEYIMDCFYPTVENKKPEVTAQQIIEKPLAPKPSFEEFPIIEEEIEDEDEEDLFENQEKLPQEIRDILDRYSEEEATYETVGNMLNELQPLGYTFDYGLDAEPYGLRKI